MGPGYLPDAAGVNEWTEDDAEWPHVQRPDVFTHLVEIAGVTIGETSQASLDHNQKHSIFFRGQCCLHQCSSQLGSVHCANQLGE